ncbi:5-formyltetrahydrofolate cyclo-ligase [Glycomyces buryatensis]|uniref:5-formyltetrahydrofolate cyclo-ligase n=1 Tax=Glycomyces buryatensis TaxID=2570927 RepID=UPI001B3C14EC|nr:5-formyltetrahydrofolate cyclo-ligase [Glycomyces buryatensis]
MPHNKPTLRAELLKHRKSLSPAERAEADRSTWNALRDLLSDSLDEGAVVAAYRPFGAEPGATLNPELPERLSEIYKVILPVVLPDNDLDWTTLGSLAPQAPAATAGGSGDGDTGAIAIAGLAMTGPRGTEEVAACDGTDAIARADAVLVPALAVSHGGTRLGRGGGSYDRALARIAPGTPVIALLRDGEFGEVVPAEAHDRSVTGVVTPSGGFIPV